MEEGGGEKPSSEAPPESATEAEATPEDGGEKPSSEAPPESATEAEATPEDGGEKPSSEAPPESATEAEATPEDGGEKPSSEAPPESATEAEATAEDGGEKPSSKAPPEAVFDRAGQLAAPVEDEIPAHTLTSFHHTFGFPTDRRDNIIYVEEGVLLYIAGNALVLLDIRGERPTRKYLTGVDGRGIGAITKHPTLPLVVVGEKGNDPNIYIYEYPEWTIVKVLRGGTEQRYSSVSFSPDGDKLASVGGNPDYMLTIWDWRNERVTLHTKAFGQDVFKVAFSEEDPGRLVSSGTGHIRFWRMANTFTGLKLQGDIGKFGKVELSDVDDFAELPDGKVLSTSESGALLLWEGNFIKCRIVRPNGASAHDGPVTTVRLLRSESGKASAFVSTGKDGRMCWWDFRTIDEAEIDADHSMDFELEPVHEMKLSMKDDVIVDEREREVAIRSVIRGEFGGSHAIIVDSNGRLLRLALHESIEEVQAAVAEGEAMTVCRVTVEGGEVEQLMSFHAGGITGLDTAPYEHYAVTAGEDGTLRCWDYVSGGEVLRGRWSSSGISCMQCCPKGVDPTGRSVAAGFTDGVLRLVVRDERTWKLSQALKPHNGPVKCLCFSKDGVLLATGGSDGTVFVLRGAIKANAVREYSPVGFIQVSSEVTALCWRSDSHALLVGCKDGTVQQLDFSEPSSMELPNPESFELNPRRVTYTFQRPAKESKAKEQGEEGLTTAAEEGMDGERSIEGESEDASPSAVLPLPAVSQVEYLQNRFGHFMLCFTGDLSGAIYECSLDSMGALNTFDVGKGPRALQKEQRRLPTPHCLSYSRDKQFLLAGSDDGSYTVRRSGTEALPLEFAFARIQAHDGDSGRVTGVGLSFDHHFLLSGGLDGSLCAHRFAVDSLETHSRAYLEERNDRLMALANDIVFNGMEKPRPSWKDIVIDAGPEGVAKPTPPEGFPEVVSSFLEPSMDSTEAPSVSPTSDITDPSTYSIQDAKLKTEEDHRRALAEEKKQTVRARIRELREDFRRLLERNETLPLEARMTEDELLVDPQYAEVLEVEGAEMLEEVKRQCRYDSEKAERRLGKLHARYIEPLEYERLELASFVSGQTVCSFPQPRVAGPLQELLEQVHSALRSEELSQAREAQEFSGASLDEDSASVLKHSLISSATKRTSNIAPNDQPQAAEKQSTFDIRKANRAARKRELEEMLEAQPGKDDDDPSDVRAIQESLEKMGDYKLKSSPDYEVGEDQAVNSEKKRRQVILLEENAINIRERFNARFDELRSLKMQIAQSIEASNGRIREIDEALEEASPTKVFKPTIDPSEWLTERSLHTAEELEQFREEVRVHGVEKATPPPLSQLPQIEHEPRVKGAPLGLNEAAANALITLDSHVLQSQLPLAVACTPVMAVLESSVKRQRKADEETERIRRVLLKTERQALIDKTREHVDAFDEAVFELHKERLILSVDLKAAEVRLLVLLQELSMLRAFETRDTALSNKLEKCKRDKAEVVSNITDVQARLKAKLEEFQAVKEVELSIANEFFQTVPTGHSFHAQLLKIFKRKVKRAKKREDDFDDEDEEESEEEEYDSEDEDDEEDEADDSCPPGCDTQLYETVIEQRSRRLDQEDTLLELQKAIDELKRTSDRHVARDKQINKDLIQTEKEIRAFQTEKQVKLNQLFTPIPLRLSQICCFEGTEEEDYDTSVMPTKLASTAELGEQVLFTRDSLVRLKARIKALEEETRSERGNFKDLHREKAKLDRSKASLEAQIAEQQAKCENLQMLRFGQLIDFEQLDHGATQDKGRLEEERKIKEMQTSNEVELLQLNRKEKGLKETLLTVTQGNTELLNKIADLSERQFFLEKELNSGANGTKIGDAGPAVKSEVEERHRLVSLVKLQAKEVDALKAEINLLRRKGGHIYIPAEPEPQVGEMEGFVDDPGFIESGSYPEV